MITDRTAKKAVLSFAGVGSLIVALALFSSSSPARPGPPPSLEGSIPHTDGYCSATTRYTKDTLKPLLDRPIGALLRSKDLKGLRKFEASDVIARGDG